MKKLLVLLLAIFTCFLFVACGDKYELNVEEAHKNVTLEVGQTFKVNATYTEGAPVSWESKNPDVVTVSNGLLTAIAVGNAKVVISIKESELSVEINVEVKDITPTAVEVTGAASVVIGQTASYSANVLPSNAKQEVVWLVDNKELADISETGVLTAKAEGTVKVTATSKVGNVVGSLDVAISKPAPTTVTISGENNVKVGATLQLSAIVAPDLASQDVEWLVDNEELATIDANGLLTPKAEGKVVVTAKAVGTDVKGNLEVTISVV